MCIRPRFAAIAVAVAALMPMSSLADSEPNVSEVLVRQNISFHECRAKIDTLLASLKADKSHVHLIYDTGAHYSVKLVASAANLEFGCNNVTEILEVKRTTPGELVAGN